MEPLDVIRTASPLLNQIGAAHYFAPTTLETGKEMGLDGFRFYMLGRGGVLGDVEAPVITSAFAYFHPASVAKIWNSAREKVQPRAAADAYGRCCGDLGRAKLADVAGLEAFNDAAEAVIAATDVAGLALFAGWAAEPLDADPAARSLQLANVLRELRGSVHIAAVLASGLTAAEAHAVKRPDEVAQFGWDPAPEITDVHRQRHAEAEHLTDQMMERSFAGLNDAQGAAYVDGTKEIAAALGMV